MNDNWRGLLTILDIKHIAKDGNVLWEDQNLRNILHKEGENLILTSCFQSDPNFPPPFYYFGLDNRTTLSETQTLSDLIFEPTTNGYVRSSVANNEFDVEQISGSYRALSPILTFSATGGSFGPIRNLFMTNVAQFSPGGLLISSVPLSNPVTVIDGSSLTVRMALSLRDITGKTCS